MREVRVMTWYSKRLGARDIEDDREREGEGF